MAANHHDTGYKELFSHPEFVQQLIEGFAPAEISGLMDFRTLKRSWTGTSLIACKDIETIDHGQAQHRLT